MPPLRVGHGEIAQRVPCRFSSPHSPSLTSGFPFPSLLSFPFNLFRINSSLGHRGRLFPPYYIVSSLHIDHPSTIQLPPLFPVFPRGCRLILVHPFYFFHHETFPLPLSRRFFLLGLISLSRPESSSTQFPFLLSIFRHPTVFRCPPSDRSFTSGGGFGWSESSPPPNFFCDVVPPPSKAFAGAPALGPPPRT